MAYPNSSLSLVPAVIACLLAPLVAPADDLEVDFAQIASGHSLQRNQHDPIYSAVIWDAEGYAEFLKSYPIDLKGAKLDFTDEHVFLVGFSNRIPHAFCDGVSRRSHEGSTAFYLDLHDSGLRIKRSAPPKGKTYTSWVLVCIPRPDAISHVQIREGITGLTSGFGTPPEAQSPE